MLFSICRLLDLFQRYSRSKSRVVQNLGHCGWLMNRCTYLDDILQEHVSSQSPVAQKISRSKVKVTWVFGCFCVCVMLQQCVDSIYLDYLVSFISSWYHHYLFWLYVVWCILFYIGVTLGVCVPPTFWSGGTVPPFCWRTARRVEKRKERGQLCLSNFLWHSAQWRCQLWG